MVYVLTGEIDGDRLILGVYQHQNDAECEKYRLTVKLAESESPYDVLTVESFDVK